MKPLVCIALVFAAFAVVRAGPPGTQPAAGQSQMVPIHFEEWQIPTAAKANEPLDRVPSGAQSIASLETVASVGQKFHCRAVIGDRTIEIEGQVWPSTQNDRYQVQFKFSDRQAMDSRGGSTSLTFKPGEQHLMSGMAGGKGQLLTTLTVGTKKVA